MGIEERSRETRTRAEEALVRFALLAGHHATDFVVIGGLNPDFLAPSAPVPHLGTTDVDLLFELGFIYDREELDFAWLDRVLVDGGFKEIAGSGWQWNGILGESLVRLDLLCDVADGPGQTIVLPGASMSAAQNLDGPAAALRDPILRSLRIPAHVLAEVPGAPDAVQLKFASLGGYIAAKSAALLARRLDKDAYDLMFVIMFGDGGARAAAAAAAVTDSPAHRTATAQTIRQAIERIVAADSGLVVSVVNQLEQAGDDTDRAQLTTDVEVAAKQFLDAFLTQ